MMGAVPTGVHTVYQWVVLKVAATLPAAAEGGFNRVELCDEIKMSELSVGLDMLDRGDRYYERVRVTVRELLDMGLLKEVEGSRHNIALADPKTQ